MGNLAAAVIYDTFNHGYLTMMEDALEQEVIQIIKLSTEMSNMIVHHDHSKPFDKKAYKNKSEHLLELRSIFQEHKEVYDRRKRKLRLFYERRLHG